MLQDIGSVGKDLEKVVRFIFETWVVCYEGIKKGEVSGTVSGKVKDRDT